MKLELNEIVFFINFSDNYNSYQVDHIMFVLLIICIEHWKKSVKLNKRNNFVEIIMTNL